MCLQAVRMNTQSNTDQISSMVDHVFFVLKKSLMRSVSTLNINSVCAISNIISSILGHRFSQVLFFFSSKLISHPNNNTGNHQSYNQQIPHRLENGSPALHGLGSCLVSLIVMRSNLLFFFFFFSWRSTTFR